MQAVGLWVPRMLCAFHKRCMWLVGAEHLGFPGCGIFQAPPCSTAIITVALALRVR